MNNDEISNLLLTLVAIAWFAKILFHFKYLKVTNEDLKNSNPISFLTNVENIFNIIVIVMPIFFGGKTQIDFGGIKAKRKVWISTCLLWLILAVTFFICTIRLRQTRRKKYCMIFLTANDTKTGFYTPSDAMSSYSNIASEGRKTLILL